MQAWSTATVPGVWDISSLLGFWSSTTRAVTALVLGLITQVTEVSDHVLVLVGVTRFGLLGIRVEHAAHGQEYSGARAQSWSGQGRICDAAEKSGKDQVNRRLYG